jgi:hypothetical protein
MQLKETELQVKESQIQVKEIENVVLENTIIRKRIIFPKTH